jgi:hypothetical protein
MTPCARPTATPSRGPNAATSGPSDLRDHPALAQHRVDARLRRGALPDQLVPVTDQLTQLPDLRRRDPRGRQPVEPQQLRKVLGVELVGLRAAALHRGDPPVDAPGSPRTRPRTVHRRPSTSRRWPRSRPAHPLRPWRPPRSGPGPSSRSGHTPGPHPRHPSERSHCGDDADRSRHTDATSRNVGFTAASLSPWAT